MQHEGKKSQMKFDKALAQLTRISDASTSTRSQGLVLLNPIVGGHEEPTAVSIHC